MQKKRDHPVFGRRFLRKAAVMTPEEAQEIKELVAQDRYDSPGRVRRSIMERIFGATAGFYLTTIWLMFKCRLLATRNMYGPEQWLKSSYEVFRNLERFGGRFHIEGMDFIRSTANEPVILVGNHMGTLEAFVFPFLIGSWKKTSFVAKGSLVRHPFFGPVMRATNPVSFPKIHTRAELKRMLFECLEKLKQGCSIVIFPEGTRTASFVPANFSSAGTRLAAKAGVRLIPVALKTDFWANGKYLKDFGALHQEREIYISFGKPMRVKGEGKKENLEVIRFIQTRLEKWGYFPES